MADHDRNIWCRGGKRTYGFIATWFFAESPIRRSVSVNATYSIEHIISNHFSGDDCFIFMNRSIKLMMLDDVVGDSGAMEQR